MRAYLLAGGHATRLQPYSDVIPKCLLPVGGEPISRIIVRRLIDEGFEDVVLCVNERFEAEFRHEFRDLDVKFSVTPEPMGTAGEVHAALQKYPADDAFLIVYGDDLTRISYKRLAEHHDKSGADATIAVTTNVPLEVGVVRLKNGYVRSFVEKPSIREICPTAYVWIGTAVFEPSTIELFAPHRDIAKDIFPEMMRRGMKIAAYVTEELWVDCGNIFHYKRAKEIFGRERLG